MEINRIDKIDRKKQYRKDSPRTLQRGPFSTKVVHRNKELGSQIDILDRISRLDKLDRTDKLDKTDGSDKIDRIDRID